MPDDDFNPEDFVDDATDAYADGDPPWDVEGAVAVAEAIEQVARIDDPGERYMASAALLKTMYGDELVVPD